MIKNATHFFKSDKNSVKFFSKKLHQDFFYFFPLTQPLPKPPRHAHVNKKAGFRQSEKRSVIDGIIVMVGSCKIRKSDITNLSILQVK